MAVSAVTRERTHRVCAKAMKLRPVDFQPALGMFVIRDRLFNQRPEMRPVIHMAKMCDFMCGHIIKHKSRRENEPPGKGERTRWRAGAPARGRVAYRDARRAHAEKISVMERALVQLVARFRLEPVEIGRAHV